MQKGGALITILIFITLLAVNAFFVTELYGWPPIELPTKSTATAAPTTTPPVSVWLTYEDPDFSFEYPSEFGTTSASTHRLGTSTTINFSNFSGGTNTPTESEGEATLFMTPNRFTAHLFGGLYDPLSRTVIDQKVLTEFDRHLPIISPENFCTELGKVRHLDTSKLTSTSAFGSLNEVQKHSLLDIDVMRSINSSIISCERNDNTISFHKTAQDHSTAPTTHVYGAIQFLHTPHASFQLIKRSQSAPDSTTIETVTRVVNSFAPATSTPSQ